MRNEIKLTGKVNGQGECRMFLGELNQWFAQNKGRSIVATFAVLPEEPTEQQKAYYLRYVVPLMQKAIWMTGQRLTEAQTDEFLRSLSPICEKKDTFEELSAEELSEHIEFVKQLAAEEYSLIIEDPKTY